MKWLALLVLVMTLVAPTLAFADTDINNPDFGRDPEGTIKDYKDVFRAISAITNWIFSLFLVMAVIFILRGAWELLVNSGEAEGFATAKRMIFYAAIAVVIATLSKSFVVVAARIVGVKISL